MLKNLAYGFKDSRIQGLKDSRIQGFKGLRIGNERRNAHFIIDMGGKRIGFVTQRYAMWHVIPSRIHDAYDKICQM